jgi:Domain of unknown function (DUF4105)
MNCMDTTRSLAGLILLLILPNIYAETISVTNNPAAIIIDAAPTAQPATASAALPSNDDALIAARMRAKNLNLARSLYWQRLMYYHPDGQDVKSRVSQATFFLAKDGSTNPEAELDATLQGLFYPNQANPNQSTACLYPVRRDWLVEQLAIKEVDLPATPCPELTQWLDSIQPKHVTMVFSSDYMNSPSSMFGHTLLRLDPNDNEQTRLLSYAINYAADDDQSNSVLYALKGLMGRYPGSYSIVPYYEKVKEYNDFESRDLWEYRLKLTPLESMRLTKRVWELRFVSFPYYFMHSNCSYELLSLLEIARPSLSLQAQFPIYAIPTDTLRASLLGGDLLDKITYRPAFASRLNAQADQASAKTITAAKALTVNPSSTISDLSAQQKASALEMASDYLYHQFVGHKVNPDFARPAIRDLLIRRSQIDIPSQRVTLPTPEINPAQGHPTSRVAVSGGTSAGHGFVDLEWRPAYHGLLDPVGGYRYGAAINFLQTNIRIQDNRLSLQKLTLLSIDSLSPISDFFRPLSWSLALGIRRIPEENGRFSTEKLHPVGYVQSGYGFSWQFGSTLCYGLASAALESGRALEKGWRVGAGPTVGCLWNLPHISLQLQNTTNFWQDDHRWQNQWQVGTQIPLPFDSHNRRHALRLAWEQTQQGGLRYQEASASWLLYF